MIGKINNFCQKNISLIEGYIDNHENIDDDNYEKLELNMRTEIQPILEKLDLYCNKDKNEKNVLMQLYNSVNILNSDSIVKANDKLAIESWIAEIHNRIINNNEMYYSEKEVVIQELLNIINSWIDKMSDMNTNENMQDVMNEILKDIAGVHINVDKFMKDLSKYDNKNTK